MHKRLFFLKQDGWHEAEPDTDLLYASHDELILWAYAEMERYGYRNYMITENPGVVGLQTRGSTLAMSA